MHGWYTVTPLASRLTGRSSKTNVCEFTPSLPTDDKMTEPGWVYVLSNKSMPHLFKIGYTGRSPAERLAEANQPDTFRPPTPYVIEFARKVPMANSKELRIHRALRRFRVSPDREFFSTDLDEIRNLFELMDGPWWKEESEPESLDIIDVETKSIDEPMTGTEVLRSFLDKHIYPLDEGVEAPKTTLTKILSVFAQWKRTHGYSYGRSEDLRDLIAQEYGAPQKGGQGGWSNFEFRV